MGRLQSETIIIPDTETENASVPANAPFEVKKIYRLPTLDSNNTEGYVWSGKQSLIATIWDKGLAQTVGRVDYPYDELTMLQSPTTDILTDGFSPDGRYIAGFARSKSGYQLKLFTLSDGHETVIETISSARQASKSLVWSENSQYFSYFAWDVDSGQPSVAVYDKDKSGGKLYSVPYGKEKVNYIFANLSDDGNSSILVKETYQGWGFLLGEWNGSEFESEYEHSLSADAQVAWINNDQIAFISSDGTLFLYDRRNDLISVLREQVVGFRLSADRQYLAFSTNENKIYVSKLQGNNLLNEKMVFQGVVSASLSWSPDNGKLLVQGRKPYLTAAEAAPAVVVNSPFIIEFQ
jgi:hypothetical protein